MVTIPIKTIAQGPLFTIGMGAHHFFARISYPCQKVEYIWTMYFCRIWGKGRGGGGGRGRREGGQGGGG